MEIFKNGYDKISYASDISIRIHNLTNSLFLITFLKLKIASDIGFDFIVRALFLIVFLESLWNINNIYFSKTYLFLEKQLFI